jgi:hypothetical protein
MALGTGQAASGGLLALVLAVLVLEALRQLAAERQHWRSVRFAVRLALLGALLDLASNVPQLRELAELQGGDPQAPREVATMGWALAVYAPASGPLPEQHPAWPATCTVLLEWTGAESSLELAVLRQGSGACPSTDPRDAHELALTPGWNDIHISDRTVLAGFALADQPVPLNVSLLLAHQPRPACVRLLCDAAWSVEPPARCTNRCLAATSEVDVGLFWMSRRPHSQSDTLNSTLPPSVRDAGLSHRAPWAAAGLAAAAVALFVALAILPSSPRDGSAIPTPASALLPDSEPAPECVPGRSDASDRPDGLALRRDHTTGGTLAMSRSPASASQPAGARIVSLSGDAPLLVPTDEMLDQLDSPMWETLFRQVEGPVPNATITSSP